jgi:hypothetical protein
MVFNATFNYVSAISWGQFYWWRKPQDPEKTTDSTNQNRCSLVWLKFQNLAMAVIEMAYEPKVYTIYRDLFIIAQISNLCGGSRGRDNTRRLRIAIQCVKKPL